MATISNEIVAVGCLLDGYDRLYRTCDHGARTGWPQYQTRWWPLDACLMAVIAFTERAQSVSGRSCCAFPSRSSRSSLPRRRRSRHRPHLPLLLPLSRRDGAPAGPQRGHLDALRVARAAAPPVCGAATRTAPRRWLPPSTAQRQGRRRGPPLAVVAASPAAAGSRRSSLLAVCLCWSKP